MTSIISSGRQAPLPQHIAEWPSYFGDMGATYDRFAFAGSALRSVADKELRIVLDALDGDPGALLDVGAGTARFSAPLAAAGWNVTAFDGSSKMLDVVADKVPGATLVEGRLGEPLPFATASFDAVVAIRVVKYVQRTQDALAEMARVTRPGGRLVFDAPNGRSLARFGYRADTIGFVTPSSLYAMAEAVGLRVVAVHDGPRLPHPVLRAARSYGSARLVAAVESAMARTLRAHHGARSLIVEAVRN